MRKLIYIIMPLMILSLVNAYQTGEEVSINMSIIGEDCGCGESELFPIFHQTYAGYKLIDPDGIVLQTHYEEYCTIFSPYDDYFYVLYQPNITFIPEKNGTYTFCTALSDIFVQYHPKQDICQGQIGECFEEDCINITIGETCGIETYEHLLPSWWGGWFNKIENR